MAASICAHMATAISKDNDDVASVQANKMKIKSAGIRARMVDGFAVATMQEIGIDISTHEPQTLNDVILKKYDLIITLSPESHHVVLTKLGHQPGVQVLFWHMMDPLYHEGNREQVLAAFRELRDGLVERIKDILG